MLTARMKGIVYGMTWQFWLRNRPLSSLPPTDPCSEIRPLLSLMSDGMASAKEARQAEAHLLTCADCRQAQLWIVATRQVISARPAVLPPADMRARIARAIAASAETAVPAVPVAMPLAMPPVRRTFAVRPAYAAAASVAVAGAFLGHYLLTSSHGPGTVPPASPVRQASAGQGGQRAEGPAKPGHAGVAPTLPAHKPTVIASNGSADLSQGRTYTKDAPVRKSSPALSNGPRASTHVAAREVSPGTPAQADFVQVAFDPRHAAQPSAVAAQPRAAVAAARLAVKPLPHSQGHSASDGPLTATLPSAHSGTGPATITPVPPPAVIAVPPTVVARVPDEVPAAPRASSGDALGSVRTSLASYRSEGYARKLSMANGVHLRQNFVQISAVWTPTSLSETTAVRRTAGIASRPASVQNVPQAASLTPVSDVTSSNQRRSERDKQWSDAPTNGGA